MQPGSLGFGPCKSYLGATDNRLAVSLSQQATLCGEPLCLQQPRCSKRRRSKAATIIISSAVLNKEETRTQEQRSAGPKGIRSNAVELVGNTPMVSHAVENGLQVPSCI